MPIILVDDELQTDAVHEQRAAKRTGFAHEPGTFLPQRAVDGLHDTDRPTAFGSGPIIPGRQHPAVGVPLVSVVPGAGVVVDRQLLPQAVGRSRAPRAQHPSHDAPGVPLDGQPEPHLPAFVAHERPHLV